MPAMMIVWIAAAVVFAIAEAATVSLVSVWFVGGALLALGASALGWGVPAQLAVFVLSTGALLAVFWPLAKKSNQKRRVRTNADRLIGRQVLVTEAVDNLHETGAVRVNGVEWTARAPSDAVLPAGTLVTIERIEGAKLFVAPVKENTPAAT